MPNLWSRKPPPNGGCHAHSWGRMGTAGCRTAGEVLSEQREQSRRCLPHTIWYYSSAKLAFRGQKTEAGSARHHKTRVARFRLGEGSQIQIYTEGLSLYIYCCGEQNLGSKAKQAGLGSLQAPEANQ